MDRSDINREDLEQWYELRGRQQQTKGRDIVINDECETFLDRMQEKYSVEAVLKFFN